MSDRYGYDTDIEHRMEPNICRFFYSGSSRTLAAIVQILYAGLTFRVMLSKLYEWEPPFDDLSNGRPSGKQQKKIMILN